MFLKHEAPQNLTHLVSQLRDNPEHLAPMGWLCLPQILNRVRRHVAREEVRSTPPRPRLSPRLLSLSSAFAHVLGR